MVLTGDYRPEYLRDLYGDSTIAFVPPVTNYLYNENISKRGINDTEFRWGEVTIDLTTIQSGAILDFLMPDYYLLQVTPDLGWHDTLAMFGETVDPSIHNPHLQNLGPFSITAGTLIDNADNSVTVVLNTNQIEQAVIDGFPNYLWRAVPWAQGNPGLGGLPASFEWISSSDQISFTVDPFDKELKKSSQVISGTKSPRVNISTESENNPTVFIEQTTTTWKVIFSIDRPLIKFKIVATDEGGSAVSNYYVDLQYDLTKQFDSHVWNSFDSFALLASLTRLGDEDNDSLRERTLDAFKNKGGTHYKGLLNGVNRELGLRRKDTALIFERALTSYGVVAEPSILIESTHTRVSVSAESFVIYDEIVKINTYSNSIQVNKRIKDLIRIKTIGNQDIPTSLYTIASSIGDTDNRTIVFDPAYSGLVKVTYSYKEDFTYIEYPKISQLVNAIQVLTNNASNQILSITIDASIGGSEPSRYLYNVYATLDSTTKSLAIGWSSIGLFSVSNEEYKWSHANSSSLFFNSEFYKFVLELKSQTNIEWGFVIADKDYWDSIDADWYGKDSLPAVFDVKISNYVTMLPIESRSEIFDSWEAFRMSYYYDGILIKNTGFPQISFKSGVGYVRDCVVSVATVAVNSHKTHINFNPLVVNPEDVINYTSDAINSIAITI